jgi:hypothetical protein
MVYHHLARLAALGLVPRVDDRQGNDDGSWAERNRRRG